MLWTLKIDTMLKAREMWSLIGGNEQNIMESHVNALTTYTKQKNHVLSYIIQSLLNNQLMVVHQETIVRWMWEAFVKQHLDKGLMNRLFFTKRFFTSQMNFSETMEQHMNKLSVMAEELKAIQAKVPLEVKVMVFLLSLSNSYKFLVTSLESYKSMKLAWEDVTTKFLNKEFMKRERSDAPNTSDVTLVQKSQNNIDSKNITRN
jgi:hypothetical protein